MSNEYEHNVGISPVTLPGNKWYVARRPLGGAGLVQYLSSDGRWCAQMSPEGVGDAGTYFETKEEASNMLAKWSTPRPPIPEWYDKPTGPGLWLAQLETPNGTEYHGQVVCEDESVDQPLHPFVLRVFGPISVPAA